MIDATFRKLFRFATPGFLQNPDFDGERVMYSLGKLCDAWTEKHLRGLEARFPSRASSSANALTAGDRGILRGRSESEADFAARLIAWRSPRTHRVRGNAYEALEQIFSYWGGVEFVDTIDSHGLRHRKDSAGVLSRDSLAQWVDDPFPGFTSWDAQDADVHWSRYWIGLTPKTEDAVAGQPDLGDPDLWGGALGTPGYTLGQVGVTPDDVSAMRSLFQELGWGPGHAQPEWLVLGLGENTDDLTPDPTWKYWSQDNGSGTRIAARKQTGWRFWSLAPEYNNTYGGIRDREWPNAATKVDGVGTFDGDRSNSSAFSAQTLPGGVTYSGSRTRFPSRVLLVDDGSVPR
jgi:hypothetical protein